MAEKASLDRLFSPQTIAFVGGDDAAAAIRQCRNIGYGGELWAVNPKRERLEGIPCYRSVAELPAAPDSSFVAAPPAASIEIIADLSAAGAGGAVCYASGFSELGGDGVELDARLRAAAADMPVIGPNCHGFLNYLDNVALWPDEHGGVPVENGVALVMQSGNFGINLSMQCRGLDMAYVVTIGNKSCLSLHEYVDYMISDSRVTAIGLHIEGIEDVHAFSRAAIRALKAKIPIVAIKTGRSARGAEINMSHTASLAGEDRLYAALFDRLGIARCHTVAQFLETLKFVSAVGALPDNTLGSMSCSGGEASLIADCAELSGLNMPSLSKESSAELHDILGPRVPLSNPLDYHTYAWGDRAKLTDCFSSMLGNANACTILVLDYPTPESADTSMWEVAEGALADAVTATGQRAVVVSTLAETMPLAARERLKAAGITPMQGIEECLFAIRAAASIGELQLRADDIEPIMEPEISAGDVYMLDEWESKAVLKKHGLSVPEGRLCDAGGTVDAAGELGYPVVLKAVSRNLAHKSDAGAVFINLGDADAVSSATDKLSTSFERFLVEKMAGPVVAEVIIGISRDETFGLNLLVGSGGTLVELMDDTVSLLLPLQREEIASAIKSLKLGVLMDAYRGGKIGDFDALVDAVVAVAEYAVANNDTLIELDVNPLIVQPVGAVAVDGLIRKRAEAS